MHNFFLHKNILIFRRFFNSANRCTTLSGIQLLRYRIIYILRQYFGYRGYDNPFYHGQPKKALSV